MSEGLAKIEHQAATIERVVIRGDLSGLNQVERAKYYGDICQSLGLNPLTRPFEYLKLNGREILYARRDCADQLRRLHNVSVTIVSRETVNESLYIVTARASMPNGRTDESIGVMSIKGKAGEELANALMKTETKAKRRVTLSVCGLGFLDESEIEDAVFDERPPSISPHDDGRSEYPQADPAVFAKLKGELDGLEAQVDTCRDYDKALKLREWLGSAAKPSELNKTIHRAREAQQLDAAQHKELSKVWQRSNRKLAKLETALQPDASASFADEPEPTGELSEDQERELF